MAKTKTRIYRIHDKLTGDIVFIRAVTAAGAINWHSRDRFSIAPARLDRPDQRPLEGIPPA